MYLSFRPLLGALLCTPLVLVAQTQDYQLKPNDSISVSVFFGEESLDADVKLGLGGEASFPFIGSIRLAGLSLKQAEQTLVSNYKPDYFVNPGVTINMEIAADERVTIMGAVNKPGPVAIPPNTTLDLVSAVASAGGLAPHADPSHIDLKRGGLTTNYNLRTLSKKGAAPIMLRHGDKINVAANAFAINPVQVLGEVSKPGPIQYPASGKLDLSTLIQMAGGLSENADARHIIVKRVTDGKEAHYNANLFSAAQSPIEPGDLITVPKSVFVGKFVNVSGLVKKPGRVAFPPDGKLDLRSALSLAGGLDRLGNKKKIVVTRQGGAGAGQSWRVNLEEIEEGVIPTVFLSPGDAVNVPIRRF